MSSEVFCRLLESGNQVVICEVHQEPLQPDAVIHVLMLMFLVPATVEVLHKRHVILGLGYLHGTLVQNVDFFEDFLEQCF